MSGEDENESHERWLVSYADFITLLFAFFAVLYATSEKNHEKAREFQESVKRYLIKGGFAGSGGAPSQVNQGDLHNTVIEPPIKTYRAGREENAVPLERAERFVEDLGEEERRSYVADVSEDEWGVRFTLPAARLFPSNDGRLREDALPFLKKLAGALARSGRKIVIEGHVAKGEAGPRGSAWDFAATRAISVLRLFEMNPALKPERLAVTSLADTRPRFTTGDLARNARLEIVLLNSDLDL